MNLDASLTTAEGALEGMVAPGQENLVEEFVQEQEQAQEQERLLGKFSSTEDLAKAYQELERKLGQRQSEPPTEQEPSQPSQDDASTDDAEAPDYVELSADEVAEVMTLAGGDKAYKELGVWARENLPEDVVNEFNEAVAKGNLQAIRWAVRALAAQAGQGAKAEPLVEPELVGGKDPGRGLTFDSQAQVLEAMNKKNNRGQRLYDVDESYRGKVQEALMRSDVF